LLTFAAFWGLSSIVVEILALATLVVAIGITQELSTMDFKAFVTF
jgi:hypothetical protein